MSKAVRWQVPFANLSGQQYRIDIYDEQDGSWSGITQLLAGEDPFTTEEDSSEDFFYPVRTQTGTLQICTVLADGTPITLDELLPADNVARPLKLWSLGPQGDEQEVEWQGFLSCEAYSQSYTAIPEHLDIPLNGVLEAMDSVEVNPNTLSGMMHVFEIVYNTFHEIEQQSGMSLFDYIFYPKTDWRIFTKYIDATAFFKRNEYNNESETTYIISGLSCKDVLERLATFMGWIVREHKTWLYFQRVGEDLGMYRQSALDFVAAFHSAGYYQSRPLVTKVLATDADWMGTGHQRSIAAGAKSVEVVAKLEKYEVRMSIPQFPYIDTQEFYRKFSYTEWLYIVAEKNLTAYSNITYNFFKATLNIPAQIYQYDGERTIQDVFASMIAVDPEIMDINIDSRGSSRHDYAEITSGAFLAQAAYETQEQNYHSPTNGMYVVWLPCIGYFESQTFMGLDAIMTIKNPLGVFLNNGYLKLSATMRHIVYSYPDYEDYGTLYSTTNWSDTILMHIRVGNKYWNGSSWQYEKVKIWVNIEGDNFKKNWNSSMTIPETDGYLIPISSILQGDTEIAIYAPIHNNIGDKFSLLAETFFSRLDMEYIKDDNFQLSDRTENHYFRLLGTNFRDEININTDLASMLNNQPSPSLIMNTTTDPMKVLDYSILAENPDTTESRRPEVDLLNRLASYYSASRQKLELDVAHIETPALPLLKLQGISPDNRVYLPLSESRDWRTEECTLTCFEAP